MKTKIILAGLIFLAGIYAGAVAMNRHDAQEKPSSNWSKWSPETEVQDELFKSVHYPSQFRTNLDTGLIERKEIE